MSFFKTIIFKNNKFLLLFIFIPLLTSCFEILEEIDMNKDGGGKMSFTLNLSQSKNKVAAIMLMDSINGYKVPSKSEAQQQLNSLSGKLKKISGISNVSTKIDWTNYIVNVNFSFSSVNILNKASKEIFAAYKIKMESLPVYEMNETKRIFSYKYNNKDAYNAYNKLKKEDKQVFKEATYTSIYRFPVMVQSSSNSQAKISKNKKAVMRKTPILNLINNKSNISNQIQLNP